MSFLLGLPLSEIENIPYSDYLRYREYKRRKGLPFERLELLIGRLCQITHGNPKAALKDFLLPDSFDNNQSNIVDYSKLDFNNLPVATNINFDLFKNKRIKKDMKNVKRQSDT